MLFLKSKTFKFRYILILLISLLVFPNLNLKSQENSDIVNNSPKIDYLDRKNVDSYTKVISKLNLRK